MWQVVLHCLIVGTYSSHIYFLIYIDFLLTAGLINFKIVLLTFNVNSLRRPHYLDELISAHQPPRSLRSAGSQQSWVPRTRTVIDGRVFNIASPTV